VHRLAGLYAISRGSATDVAENTESSFATGMRGWWGKGFFTTETQRHRRTQEGQVHRLAGLCGISRDSVTEVAENTESSFATGIRSFSRIDARSWCYVGQDGILRRVGNPPLSGTGQCIGRPSATRPQDAILPHIDAELRCPSGRRTSVISPTSVSERREDAAPAPISAILAFSLCLCDSVVNQ